MPACILRVTDAGRWLPNQCSADIRRRRSGSVRDAATSEVIRLRVPSVAKKESHGSGQGSQSNDRVEAHLGPRVNFEHFLNVNSRILKRPNQDLDGPMAGAGESNKEKYLLSEYKEHRKIRNGQPSAPGMDCISQQNRGPRPAKRTPKAIKMRPCVFWKAFGTRSAPGVPTGSCATTFWTAFCSQMGTQWGSIFARGLTSTASLAHLARIEK